MGYYGCFSLAGSENTTDVCATLLWRLVDKGLSPSAVNRLVKDVFNLLKNGGSFTVPFVNCELERLGWEKPVLDEQCFELILVLLEKEFDYTVATHALN